MNFREFLENWDHIGSGATPEEERFAHVALQRALSRHVKTYGRSHPNFEDYKTSPVYIGQVSDFFPRAGQVDRRLASVAVYFDPRISGCAANTNGAEIRIGKEGYKNYGSSGSLGATFLHEVEHIWDALKGHYTNSTPGQRAVSEFTPRLRQMLRQLKDEPNMRIWTYLGKHGKDHAEFYVDNFLRQGDVFSPTPEEREFAVQSLIKRAKEIYDQMVSSGNF